MGGPPPAEHVEACNQMDMLSGVNIMVAGYGGRVVAEMDKLKTMARKTEDRRQLGELMALVAEKATVAVAVKPDRVESKVSLRHAPLPVPADATKPDRVESKVSLRHSLLPVPAERCALQGC